MILSISRGNITRKSKKSGIKKSAGTNYHFMKKKGKKYREMGYSTMNVV